MFAAEAPPRTPLGELRPIYSAPQGPCIGEGKRRGRDGREGAGKGREGAGKGRGEEGEGRRRELGRRGRNGPPLFGSSLRPCGLL